MARGDRGSGSSLPRLRGALSYPFKSSNALPELFPGTSSQTSHFTPSFQENFLRENRNVNPFTGRDLFASPMTKRVDKAMAANDSRLGRIADRVDSRVKSDNVRRTAQARRVDNLMGARDARIAVRGGHADRALAERDARIAAMGERVDAPRNARINKMGQRVDMRMASRDAEVGHFADLWAKDEAHRATAKGSDPDKMMASYERKISSRMERLNQTTETTGATRPLSSNKPITSASRGSVPWATSKKALLNPYLPGAVGVAAGVAGLGAVSALESFPSAERDFNRAGGADWVVNAGIAAGVGGAAAVGGKRFLRGAADVGGGLLSKIEEFSGNKYLKEPGKHLKGHNLKLGVAGAAIGAIGSLASADGDDLLEQEAQMYEQSAPMNGAKIQGLGGLGQTGMTQTPDSPVMKRGGRMIANQRLMNSTNGLVQGLNRSRH